LIRVTDSEGSKAKAADGVKSETMKILSEGGQS